MYYSYRGNSQVATLKAFFVACVASHVFFHLHLKHLYLVHLIPAFPGQDKFLPSGDIEGPSVSLKLCMKTCHRDMDGRSWNLWVYRALEISLLSRVLDHLVYRIF